MKLTHSTSEIFLPDGTPELEALARVTHLGVGAHQDDLEFMAFHGILACYKEPDRWFGGVTVTNGGGSARLGTYAQHTDEQMMAIRRQEQNAAARIGEYSFMAQLGYPSSAVRDPGETGLEKDLEAILSATRPEVVYTHNPADKHDTHVAVLGAVIRAARALPPEQRPQRLLGCEVWRDLDWMMDEDKVVLDVSGHESLAAALCGVFKSQIAGGKRYDLAVMGRRRANATFLESHATDEIDQAWFAMDLTPLLNDDARSMEELVLEHIHHFSADVQAALRRHVGDQT